MQYQKYMKFIYKQFVQNIIKQFYFRFSISFSMHTPSQFQEQPHIQAPKIYFSQKVFGKPTKNRTQDPSMFDLLTWNSTGVQPANFKKNQRFTDPQTAYVNMIAKNAWISQSQQSYLNFHQNSLEVNEQVFHQVQNYIHSHQSKNKQKAQSKQIKNNNKSNKSDIYEQNKILKDSYLNVRQNNALKVSSTTKKVQNYSRDIHQKENHSLKPQQIRNRPQSAKNIQNLTSPKNNKISKYIPKMPADQIQDQKKMFQKRDQITDQEQQKLIEKFKQTTRWIPNSSFTTYFGKPPFQNYGRGNTKPVDGGLIYGTYLYSHNVYPHRGSNSPSHMQSYPVALMKAKSMGRLIPSQPKTSCKYLQNKINNQKQRQYDGSGAIQAQKNNFQPLQIQVPNLHGVQKFGGTKSSSKVNFYLKSQINGQYEGSKYSKKRI